MANEKKIEATMSSFLKDITKSSKRFTEKFSIKDLNSQWSITKIKEFFPDIDANELNFETASMEDVNKEILDPNIKNWSTSDWIPGTILKQSRDIHCLESAKSVNYCINKDNFKLNWNTWNLYCFLNMKIH